MDAGLGNLASVHRALTQVGGSVQITSDPDEVARARTVVFPGQSAFGAQTQRIIEGPMGAALKMVMGRGDPFLGICLGMQLLFDGSDENGGQEGLHVLPGQCRRFPADMALPPEHTAMALHESAAPGGERPEAVSGEFQVSEVPPPDPPPPPEMHRKLKVPHMGWNEVQPTGEHYYFVHSYYVEPERIEDVMWVTTYGSIQFPAAVRRQNVLGCQFHPEKSQRAGLRFLRAFVLGGWG